jgi:hypothetical protein
VKISTNRVHSGDFLEFDFANKRKGTGKYGWGIVSEPGQVLKARQRRKKKEGKQKK